MTRFMDAAFSDQTVAVALRVLKRTELEAVMVHAILIIDLASENRLWERKRVQWAKLAVEPIEGTTILHIDAEKPTAATALSVSKQDIEKFNWQYVGEPNLERQMAREDVSRQVGNMFHRAFQNFAFFGLGVLLGLNRRK